MMSETCSDAEWERGLAALRKFVALRGPGRLPTRAMADGVQVGLWAAKRREEYWAGVLAPERVAALQIVPGWDWSGPHQRRWEDGLAAVQRYVAEHGTTVVPADAWMGKLAVGAWVRAQHTSFTAGTLPRPLAARLEAVPGWEWTGEDERWDRGMRTLRAYAAMHGSVGDIDADVVHDRFRLGAWVQRCREDHRARALTAARTRALEATPGWRWSSGDERWERALHALHEFVAEHGHARPPQHAVVDGVPIGVWTRNRRKEYRAARLSSQRVAELEALPGWTWAEQDMRWLQGLSALQRFVEEHGHASPPRAAVMEGYRIGHWVDTQRLKYRRGRLAADRVERLEALPGWVWDPRGGPPA
ncbi:helicase associated domain-containing protein [Pseudonocardia nigra]|uniref:helicase associated domain-containing protein n=1 Tax=Pseudonocardia nigra TaxID=1921578 RepID=UPI001C5CF98D|nr:helicase associated domain-containing protein [Pseudonocardia nigra]